MAGKSGKSKRKVQQSLPIKTTNQSLVRVFDITPAGANIVLPRMVSPAKIPSLRDPTLKYVNYSNIEGEWRRPEYPLEDVGRLEDLDSLVRQAFQKKIGLMFKEGYELVGKNIKTIFYVKTRLKQIAQASLIPEAQLLREIGTDLIKRSNCILIKVRKSEASGGKSRIDADGKELDPIAAYFPAPVETMEVKISDNGKIVRWRQSMPDGTAKEFRPSDVVHIYFDRKKGFLFGTPTIIPVMDDLRALRQIEQNVELLIYQHLFPLFHYKVGSDDKPAGMTEDGKREIDVVKEEIQYMPSEGGIVTPERHEIKMIGVEGRVLNAEKYLDYWKVRVLGGLGLSEIDVGQGDSANRSTSETMSKSLVDDVKNFQDVLEIFFNELIIKELLLESTFGDEVLDDKNIVKLKFYEIDIDKRIKVETHAADMFSKNIYTWPEARHASSLEPVEVPPNRKDFNEEDFPEWDQTFWKLFEEPKLIIGARDESYLGQITAAANKSISSGEGDVSEAMAAEERSQQNENNLEIEREKIKAKAKTTVARKSKGKDFILEDSLKSKYLDLLEDTIDQLVDWNEFYFDKLVLATAGSMISELTDKQRRSFISGYIKTGKDSIEASQVFKNYSNRFSYRADMYISRLMRRLSSSVRRNHKISTTATDIRSIFDALKFRIDFITDVEIRKAWNLGRLIGSGRKEFTIRADHTCDVCGPHNGAAKQLNPLDFEQIPPMHHACNCSLLTN